MKNIHIIPTDKPSRLALLHDDKLHIGTSWKKDFNVNPQNIYITSDEEISGLENNIWVILGNRVFLWQNTMALVSNNKPIKIILTTDPDLIKDGVQAIDDEFLQWFVENPSCEEVEVESLNIGDGKLGYVICKPKEKPKQETLEEAAEDYYKQFENLPVVRFNAFIAGGKWQAERIFGWLSNKDYLSDDVKYIKEEWFKQFPTV
jgi:hypothetical protein